MFSPPAAAPSDGANVVAPAKMSLLLDKQALKVGGVHLPTGKITAPDRVADFFCRATLLYLAPPPDGHEDLYVQLLTHVLKTTKVTFGVVVIALRYFDMYTRLAAEYNGGPPTATGAAGAPDAAGDSSAPPVPPKLAGQVRYVIASLMTAAKFLDDVTYGNRSWSVVSGIPHAELTDAEINMLGVLAYGLHMQVVDYQQWMGRLQTITNHLETNRFARFSAPAATPGLAPPAAAVGGTAASTAGGGVASLDHRARLLTITRMPLARPTPFPLFDRPATPLLPVITVVVVEDGTVPPVPDADAAASSRAPASTEPPAVAHIRAASLASPLPAEAAPHGTHRSPRKGAVDERRASVPILSVTSTGYRDGVVGGESEDEASLRDSSDADSAGTGSSGDPRHVHRPVAAAGSSSAAPATGAPSLKPAATATGTHGGAAIHRARSGSAAHSSAARARTQSGGGDRSGAAPQGRAAAGAHGPMGHGSSPSQTLMGGIQAGLTMVMRSIRSILPEFGTEPGDEPTDVLVNDSQRGERRRGSGDRMHKPAALVAAPGQ